MGAGDHGEPGAVDDLIDGGGCCLLGHTDVHFAHRPGRVDDDDLASIPFAYLPRCSCAGTGHRDDGVHVRATVWQELVLIDLGAEISHLVASSRVGTGANGWERGYRWTAIELPVSPAGPGPVRR